MNGTERRARIIRILQNSERPVSGGAFAAELQVSRQVIVQDIALIRANGIEIISTNRGYVLPDSAACSRIFKVQHSDEDLEEELTLFVDTGGTVEDVFIYHRAYDIIRGELGIRSRLDVEQYMEKISSGKSTPLKNITQGYHYHTVTAASEEILDVIEQRLKDRGFLAELTDFEPTGLGRVSGLLPGEGNLQGAGV